MMRWKGKRQEVQVHGTGVGIDRSLELKKAANNWRKTSFSLLLLNFLLVGGLVYTSKVNSIETFVLEKEGNNYSILGRIEDLAKAQNSATDEQIFYFLNQFIVKSKFLPNDLSIYEKNYTDILSLMNMATSKKLDSYLKDENYAEKIRKGQTVEIVLNTSLKLENSYQIRWTQKVFDKDGKLKSSTNYIGVFTIEFADIKNKETLINNPLGIIITNFIQSEERV